MIERRGQAAGTGRPGGGSAARPSAAKTRRTAWGSVTAPRIRRGPPQRSHTRISIANTRWRSWAHGHRLGARAPASVRGVVRRGRRDDRRAPFGPWGEEAVIREQGPARRGHKDGEPLQQLQRVHQERRRAVAPGPLKRIQQLAACALRQPLHGQRRPQEVNILSWPRHRLSFPSTPSISRAMPADDLLDQFLAEPSGQWARAQ